MSFTLITLNDINNFKTISGTYKSVIVILLLLGFYFSPILHPTLLSHPSLCNFTHQSHSTCLVYPASVTGVHSCWWFSFSPLLRPLLHFGLHQVVWSRFVEFWGPLLMSDVFNVAWTVFLGAFLMFLVWYRSSTFLVYDACCHFPPVPFDVMNDISLTEFYECVWAYLKGKFFIKVLISVIHFNISVNFTLFT